MPQLSDPSYRLLLRGRALSHASGCTIPEANAILRQLFPPDVYGRSFVYNKTTGPGVYVPMFVRYSFDSGGTGTLPPAELALVTNTDILPTPAGVDFEIT